MNTLIAGTLGAVYIYIYIVYSLNNKKENNIIKIDKKIAIEAYK